jgi:hypothetical protein
MQTIDTCPKDRRVLLFTTKWVIGRWREGGVISPGSKKRFPDVWIDDRLFTVIPTHWDELPKDPE